MKLLIAAPTYLPSRRANTIQVVKMAEAIQNLDHKVRVLVPNHGRHAIPHWNELSAHYGLEEKLDLCWLPVIPQLRGYDYGYKVIRYFKRSTFDFLYTRLPQAAALGSSLNVPTIYEVHDLPSGRIGPWLFHRFVNGSGACRLVVISDALKQALQSLYPSLHNHPMMVIAPDGVDLKRYLKIPSPPEARLLLMKNQFADIKVDRFTVGYTGHLYEGRGIRLILEIAQQLPQYNFILAGGDSQPVEKLRYEIKIRKLNNVLLTGFIPNRELPKYQAACEVLLMPYQQKVAASSGGNIAPFLSPMKLFEYMACGRVILSSDLPVLCEVLNEKNAILLPPGDVNDWVEALEGIHGDLSKQKALGEQARRDSERYTWKSRVEKIFSFQARA